jgi:hypothetical protein
MYYAISPDFTREPGMIKVDDDLKGFNEKRYAAGQVIEDWPDGIVFYFEGNRVDNYWKPRLAWNIVSDQVVDVFQQHRIQGVQFLPVKVIHIQTRNSYQYWNLNVIQKVISLRRKYVQRLDIFRRSNNRGGALPDIYISGKLRTYLEEADATSGLGFRPIPERTLDKEL